MAIRTSLFNRRMHNFPGKLTSLGLMADQAQITVIAGQLICPEAAVRTMTGNTDTGTDRAMNKLFLGHLISVTLGGRAVGTGRHIPFEIKFAPPIAMAFLTVQILLARMNIVTLIALGPRLPVTIKDGYRLGQLAGSNGDGVGSLLQPDQGTKTTAIDFDPTFADNLDPLDGNRLLW